MELLRQKNVATRVTIPFINANNRPLYFSGTVWGSLTNKSITAYSYQDGQASATLTIVGTPIELGTTGMWEMAFTQAEMNPDSGADDYIIVKFKADEIDEQAILIILQDYDVKVLPEVNVKKWNDTTVTGDGDWNELQTDVDTLITNVPDVISLANINAQVDTALFDIGLDHLLAVSVTGADVADNSIFAKLVSKSATADWDNFVNTTDSLQALADQIVVIDGLVDTLITNIPNVLSLANINAEMVDVMGVDTIPELGVGAPAVTPTFKTAIMALYMSLINQNVTDTVENAIYNNAGTKIMKSPVSEVASVFTKSNFVSA